MVIVIQHLCLFSKYYSDISKHKYSQEIFIDSINIHYRYRHILDEILVINKTVDEPMRKKKKLLLFKWTLIKYTNFFYCHKRFIYTKKKNV